MWEAYLGGAVEAGLLAVIAGLTESLGRAHSFKKHSARISP